MKEVEQLIEQKAPLTILCYAPIKGEPNLLPLYSVWLKQGIFLYFPSISTNGMCFYRVQSLEDLKLFASTIREPVPHIRVPLYEWKDEPSCIALIPGLAFDVDQHRLGFGKGYFDRFLSSFKGLKIGVTYSQFLYQSVPIMSHDISMDLIICEKSSCKNKKIDIIGK